MVEIVKVKKSLSETPKKARVLVEYDIGTYEYEVLRRMQEEGNSIAASLRDHVTQGVHELGELLGMKKA